MTAPRGARLRLIRDITEVHLGRTVTVANLTGTLAGLIPVGGRYQAVLILGGARVFTDALPGDTAVEVWTKGSRP